MINLKKSNQVVNSHFDFEREQNWLKSKRSQAEIIVTVLLILIALVAVGIVSMFVINLVRENLKGTDCFKTTGQLEIKLDEGVTSFDSVSKKLSITIERGTESFNLTGIVVAAGSEASSETYTVKSGTVTGITMYPSGENLSLPNQGQKLSYIIQTTSTAVNTVSIAPVINDGQKCSVVDEVKI